MMTKICNMRFKAVDCSLMLCQYTRNRLALKLIAFEDQTPVATVTVNVPSAKLDNDEAVIKTYGENEGMLDALIATGEITVTARVVDVGRASRQPVVRINRLSVAIGRCPTCMILGFAKSIIPKRCEFCDGTIKGNPPDYWAENPHHALEDWKYEVANNDTRLGYHEWALSKAEQEVDELCQSQT